MPLLGRSWLKHFKNILERFIGMIDVDDNVKLAKLISNYESKLTNKPVMKTQRRIPYSRINNITKELNTCLENKIIEPVKDLRWADPITPVFKNNGSLRLKETVNPALEDFKYPIPRINKLARGKIDFK
ncbi:uncharacterized protein LOC135923416 [Gordionus sp. m RMFG-2023]|uniref:uncharacterized protein LOC135923416 n=1 Tax=Gordionus sp. m RMFG-2023 TaxID=3053472 RepID=UPI0031FC5887